MFSPILLNDSECFVWEERNRCQETYSVLKTRVKCLSLSQWGSSLLCKTTQSSVFSVSILIYNTFVKYNGHHQKAHFFFFRTSEWNMGEGKANSARAMKPKSQGELGNDCSFP